MFPPPTTTLANPKRLYGNQISASVVIVTLFVLINLLQTTFVTGVCPDGQKIKPCTCDEEGLRCIQIDNLDLTKVFEAPSTRKALRRIWIHRANLDCLSPDSFGAYIIRDLFLDLNRISVIEPGAFGVAARTLSLISLARNSLTSFPFKDIESMVQLKQISLAHNNIKSIEANAFPKSTSLITIDLSQNKISLIGEHAFMELHWVMLIDLSRNRLTNVGNRALEVNSSSRHLAISLRGNGIEYLAPDSFGKHHPYTLDLSLNQLTYLDEATFSPLIMNDTIINVDENPFTCYGCELYRWLLQIDRSHLSNIENFSCPDNSKLEDLTLFKIGCSY